MRGRHGLRQVSDERGIFGTIVRTAPDSAPPDSTMKRVRRSCRGTAVAMVIVAVSFVPVTSALHAVAGATTTHDLSGTSWTVYHGDPAGSGADTSGVSFSAPALAWKSPALDGQLYGEPLEATGRVFAATENDTVYALAANTGAVLWATHVGTPVPQSDLPCGDIGPVLGITGTPVIDAARAEIFAVADELVGGAISHHLVGLNLYSGRAGAQSGRRPGGIHPVGPVAAHRP